MLPHTKYIWFGKIFPRYILEVKRFTENAVHRGAVSSVRFTIRSFFIFGSVRFIRSFLVPLRQIKKREKKE